MTITVLRHLELSSPLSPGLPCHVSAASGLVKAGEWLHVVPDDGLDLATFAWGKAEPGQLHRLFGDSPLPTDEKARKSLKPDLESMTLVPYGAGQALLALGSGSTERRRRGVLQPLFDCGEVEGSPRVFDLGPLYAALDFQELNIEGLAACGDTLFLGQRGNSAEARNALIALDLGAALLAIEQGRAWTSDLMRDQPRPIGLGTVRDVRLTLTDLSPLGPHHLLIAAAAEDTENPYDDGEVLGSVLGRYSLLDGTMTLVSLDGPWKVEGVEALEDGRILMVTDGDDPHQPAVLLEASGVIF